MEAIEILTENIINIDEIKLEPEDHPDAQILKFTDGGKPSPLNSEIREENEEEELKMLLGAFLDPEEVTSLEIKQELEDPLEMDSGNFLHKNTRSIETEKKLMESIILKRLRYPPLEPQDSDIGTSESEIDCQRGFEVPVRKKPKVHTVEKKKVVEAACLNMLKGAALVNELVTSPSTSSQASTVVNDTSISSHPSSSRTSKHKKTNFSSFSSSINSEPRKSCRLNNTHTSVQKQLPTPGPHNSKSSLVFTAKSKDSPLVRQELNTSAHQFDEQSELPPSIGMQILEKLHNIELAVSSLNDRVKTLENLTQSPESSIVTSSEGSKPNKVLLDRGLMISPSSLHTVTTTGDLNEFLTALLLGVFDVEEAKLYRLYPRDASNKTFPQNFIEFAKSQYASYLERQGHKPPYARGVLNKVLTLLSRKATELGGRRGNGHVKKGSDVASLPSTEYFVDPTTGELSADCGEAALLMEPSVEKKLMEAADKEIVNSDEEL